MDLSPNDILLLIVAAAGIGISKSGFAGISMVHVLVFAFVFGAKSSTGVLLPMLIIGDLLAIKIHGRKVDWKKIRQLLPATMTGVIVGTFAMDRMNEDLFKPTVGVIILVLSGLQVVRIWRPKLFDQTPHEKWFAWLLGFVAGVTTMLANAAGPVVALYFLAIGLPKLEFVACSAWFFLIINVFKIPFSMFLGLINLKSLVIDTLFSPAILVGMLIGKWMLDRIPQKLFDSLLLAFTIVAALRLVGIIAWGNN